MITCNARPTFLAACAVACVFVHGSPARAQVVEDQASARTLFNDARDLMAKGHYSEACPKLEAASQLYSGSGVLLNLADCYEHVGRTASAWTEFGEAASAADRQGRPDDKDEAERRQRLLESKLSKLTVVVASAPPGLLVRRDGTELARGAWGVAVPLDPGAHALSAEAPGKQTWWTALSVTEAGNTVTVRVPELSDTAPSAATPAPSPTAVLPGPRRPGPGETTAPSIWTGQRIAAVATAGAGVLALGAGGILGVAAKSTFATAQSESGAARVSDSGNAVSGGNVATGVVVAGAVLAAGGIVLWLTAPTPRPRAEMGVGAGEILVRGVF
jgi:hypothetical protein